MGRGIVQHRAGSSRSKNERAGQGRRQILHRRKQPYVHLSSLRLESYNRPTGTFTGIPKPAVLQNALQTPQFARFLPKITYRLHPGRIPNRGESPFAVEAEHRMAMTKLVAASVDLAAAPLVIMSDVDEIPAAHTIELVKKCAFPRVLHLQLRNFVYSFEWPSGWRSWRAQVHEWGEKSYYRHSMAGEDILADAGWHCR
jgi:beta-1,4-mannosyl-glycoprotein beta-1,4-N-acetylglucosaminyltransferase